MFELNVGQDLPWKSPEEVGQEMRKYVALGPDFVKIGASGDGKLVNSEIGQDAVLRFSPEQLREMAKAVHDAGKIIQAHTTSAEALRIVVESGFDMTQHCAFTGPVPMYEATIKLMLDRKFYCVGSAGLPAEPLPARSSVTTIEVHGVESIPDADRDASVLDFVGLCWGGANSIATAVLGAFPIMFGLSFWRSRTHRWFVS